MDTPIPNRYSIPVNIYSILDTRLQKYSLEYKETKVCKNSLEFIRLSLSVGFVSRGHHHYITLQKTLKTPKNMNFVV